MARKKTKTNLMSFLRLRFFIFLSSLSCFRLISLASNLNTCQLQKITISAHKS